MPVVMIQRVDGACLMPMGWGTAIEVQQIGGAEGVPVVAAKGANEKAKKKGGRRRKGRKVVKKREDPNVLDLGSVADGVGEDLPIDGLQEAEGEEAAQDEGVQSGGVADEKDSAETGFVRVDATPGEGQETVERSSAEVTPGSGAGGAQVEVGVEVEEGGTGAGWGRRVGLCLW